MLIALYDDPHLYVFGREVKKTPEQSIFINHERVCVEITRVGNKSSLYIQKENPKEGKF